ncbi:bifunctional ornithine acetyltransferase/N-acetylglutamate synthase, partial [Nodularia sphaerocarpa]|uniref:bifunctional ornithine acetyltransferase/N-acetylglutamate synthase n=1 Tax=Nodularia sphaerocarpa TaxID=137816 RepID=UPI002331440D
LEAMLTAVCQHLAKAIARDGEGATCLIEVQVTGAYDQVSARQIAKTIAGSSLVKSAIFGRDPNWGRIAAAAGRASVNFEQDNLQIKLGDFLLLENGQPVPFDRAAASAYLKQTAADSSLSPDLIASNNSNGLSGDRRMIKSQRVDNPVIIAVNIGNGHGYGKAWGCDLSYDYVKINAEYTT